MYLRSTRRVPPSSPESQPDLTDDGGSGLLEACKARFGAADFRVTCDVRHTVWVKRAGGLRHVGLSPWLLRRHSVEELLNGVEQKLDVPASNR